MTLILEDGPEGRAVLFRDARRVLVAETLAEVAPVLAALDAARKDGFWAAGYLSYEAGFAFEQKTFALDRAAAGPRMVFGVFDAPQSAEPFLQEADQAAKGVALAPLEPLVSRAAYGAAFRQVQDYIRSGDCYQINLTFPMATRLVSGGPVGLYGALRRRQSVGHGAYVDLGHGPVLVSRSPELFLRISETGRLEARPMKGTAPRDPDPVRDAELAEELRASLKGQAENLMIVDLLRNDISRVSRVGSVKVPKLFAIEHFATLHQMVSTVVGDLVDPPSMQGIMAALFPCGSITGAPKIRAMEIIRQVEPEPRGPYCGAIGWMAPNGRASFNVAIRTLAVTQDKIRLNVGGGIVQDSTEDGEWEEALWKARYLKGLIRSLG